MMRLRKIISLMSVGSPFVYVRIEIEVPVNTTALSCEQ